MKLKSDFVTHTIEDTQFLLSVGGKSFNGIVGNNETAAFIIDRLQNDVTKEEIVDAMLKEYDADRETVQKDVERILDSLRKINALEEYSLGSADRSDAASEAPVDMKTTTFEELLRRDGKLVYQVKGSSMTPMLRERKDIVVISAVSGRLRKNDVALYRIGNNYVLHRVIKARSDSYVLRGDANYLSETIPIQNVFGVLTSFVRNGKEYSVANWRYRAYCVVWQTIFPLRSFLLRRRRFLITIARKQGVLPLLRRVKRSVMG